MEGDGGGGDREKRGWEGVGVLWETEDEGAGSGFHRWPFAIEKMQRREPTNIGWEPGLKGTGSRRFKPPCPPPSNADALSSHHAVHTSFIDFCLTKLKNTFTNHRLFTGFCKKKFVTKIEF